MYTTQASVEAKLGQYKDMITSGLSDSEIAAFIIEADDIIEGYIAAAVTLPFATTPKLITAISTDIAVRNLWAQKQAKNLPEHVKQDYDNAIKNLVAIGKGTLKLTAQDPESESFSDLKFSAVPRSFGDTL
jgi:phage gp36-like protein